MAIKHNLNQQKRRAQRIHARIIATAGRPKLLLTRSNKAIYLQVIDHHGKIIAASSEHSLVKATGKKLSGSKTNKAQLVGTDLGKKLQQAKIKSVSVDRGACKYHGRLKAAVEAVKQTGVEI